MAAQLLLELAKRLSGDNSSAEGGFASEFLFSGRKAALQETF